MDAWNPQNPGPEFIYGNGVGSACGWLRRRMPFLAELSMGEPPHISLF